MRRGGSANSALVGGITVFGFFASLALGSELVIDPATSDSLQPWFLAFLLTIPGGLFLIAKVSQIRATQYFAGMCLILTALMALCFKPSAEHRWLVVALGTFGLVGCIGGTIAIFRFMRPTSDVGNPISVMASRENILEFNGIHFVADVKHTPFGGTLRLLLQNAYDGARTFEVTLEPQRGDADRQVTSIAIPPLAVLRIELPIVVRSGYADLNLRLATSGFEGKRRRMWEAKQYENKAGLGTKLAMHGLGVMVPLSDGTTFRFGAGPESGGPPRQHTVIDITQTNEVLTAIRNTGGPA